MIKDYEKDRIRPASINLVLDKVFKIKKQKVIDWNKNIRPEFEEIKLPYTLKQGKYIMCKTLESLEVPQNLTCLVFPTSKIMRSGLLVNGIGSAGPGYQGVLHTGIYNVSGCSVILRKGMEIIKLMISDIEGNTIPFKSEWIGGKII